MTKILQILVLFFLCFCTRKETPTKNNLVGVWVLDEMEIKQIHAVFKVPYNEVIKNNSYVITMCSPLKDVNSF